MMADSVEAVVPDADFAVYARLHRSVLRRAVELDTTLDIHQLLRLDETATPTASPAGWNFSCLRHTRLSSNRVEACIVGACM